MTTNHPPVLPRHAASCGRKHQYLTAAEAQGDLESWQPNPPPTLQVYRCTACGLYHLGNYAGRTD